MNTKRTLKRFFETVLGIRRKRWEIIQLVRLRRHHEEVVRSLEKLIDCESDYQVRCQLRKLRLRKQVLLHTVNYWIENGYYR
jgi:hypothetical protein